MDLMLAVVREWSLLSISGLALVMVFKATGVFNLAQGQLLLLAGYLMAHLAFALPMWLALVVVLLVQVPVALLMSAVLRPLTNRADLWGAAVATVALGLVLEAFLSLLWRSRTMAVPSPVGRERVEILGSAVWTSLDILCVLVALVLMGAVIAGQKYSSIGLALRARSESMLLASQSGVNVRRLFVIGWIVGLMLAALAGILYGARLGAGPGLVPLGILGLVPVLVGGLDSLTGVFAGAVVCALVMQVASLTLGGHAATPALFLVLLVTLIVRPRGIFGSKVAERA